METVHEDRRQPFMLPSIATMTQGMHPDATPSPQPSNIDTRDSGNWSMQSPSKHSSTVSSHTGLHLQTILNHDDPNRFSGATSPVSARYPSHHSSLLPSLNQPFDQTSAASVDASSTSFLDSRRSSIDSRVNVNMGHLAINNPTSPFESANVSQASLPGSMHSQQTQHRGQPRTNGSTALSPQARRPQTAAGHPPQRQAPQIVSNLRGRGMPDPMASQPTKGFAWAFPDQPENDDMEELSRTPSHQGSFAPSITSSIHTADTSFTHHHTMQHKSVTSLQATDGAMSTGNYSRTPELRISHKLAERKRRSEMKDLFDALNNTLPTAASNKSSKWEILSKAIDYIQSLQKSYHATRTENEKLKAELVDSARTREEAASTQTEISVMWQQLKRLDPNGNHIYGPRTHQLAAQDTQQAPPPPSSSSRLPPLQSHPPPSAPPPNQPLPPLPTGAQPQPQQQQTTLPMHTSQSQSQQQQQQPMHAASQWTAANSSAHQSSQMQGVEYSQGYDRR